MSYPRSKRGHFPSADQDARSAKEQEIRSQCASPSYKLAFQDPDFLLRDELRPVRLQLELLKPELVLQEEGIESTVVVYGSARLLDPETANRRLESARALAAENPEDKTAARELQRAEQSLKNSRYFEEARKLGKLISSNTGPNKMVVITGGGAGIMGAANQGAHDAGAKSIGMNIVLPHEQEPNRYITPELCFQFHYFAIRKMHLLMRAKAMVAFPGGFGTLDELFETITLVQTGKIEPFPILLFGKDFWNRLVDFQFLVDQGTISAQDLELFQYVETAEEAWEIICRGNGLPFS
ncbi:MAG: TIGR00730 family Rossman fold protein [Desulfovibrionales bacterium]